MLTLNGRTVCRHKSAKHRVSVSQPDIVSVQVCQWNRMWVFMQVTIRGMSASDHWLSSMWEWIKSRPVDEPIHQRLWRATYFQPRWQSKVNWVWTSCTYIAMAMVARWHCGVITEPIKILLDYHFLWCHKGYKSMSITIFAHFGGICWRRNIRTTKPLP